MTWFLSFSLQQRKLDPIGHRTENLRPFYVTALVFERYTLVGLEKFWCNVDIKPSWDRSCSVDTRQ